MFAVSPAETDTHQESHKDSVRGLVAQREKEARGEIRY